MYTHFSILNVHIKLTLMGKFACLSSGLIVFPTRVVKRAPLETVSSVMEKRETFVQAVSKELVEEFLQFVQLDVSCVLFLLSF